MEQLQLTLREKESTIERLQHELTENSKRMAETRQEYRKYYYLQFLFNLHSTQAHAPHVAYF